MAKIAKKIKKTKKTMVGVDVGQGKDSSVVVSRSPVPVKKIETLNFYDALREVTIGKKITRVSWENNETYLFLAGEFLMIHIGEKDHQLIVSRGDIEGIDWFVLPEKESN